VIAAGYLLGSTLMDMREQTRPASDKIYEAAPVSIGPLVKTLYVDMVPLSDGQTGAILPSALTGEIEPKQTVLLFDKNGNALPTPAKVRKTGPSADSPDYTKIVLDMPGNIDSSILANKAGILVKNILISKRLPHKAMAVDADGATYLWTVKEALSEENSDVATNAPAFIAQRINFTPSDIGDDYFSVGREVRSGTPVILNPDDDLRDGPLNNVEITELDAPLKGPLARAQLRDERKNYILALEEARRYYEEFKRFQPVACPGADPATAAAGTCGTCGAPAPTLPEPNSMPCNTQTGADCSTTAQPAGEDNAAETGCTLCGSGQ